MNRRALLRSIALLTAGVPVVELFESTAGSSPDPVGKPFSTRRPSIPTPRFGFGGAVTESYNPQDDCIRLPGGFELMKAPCE